MKQYLIYAPPYDELSGGAVCLHYLCHLLNENGFSAALVPFFNHDVELKVGPATIVRSWLKEKKRLRKQFITYPLFNTPVLKDFRDLPQKKDCCVIYPEVVNGNPLNGKNVVRWLLHNPGFHTGEISYGAGEIFFKFNSALEDFKTSDSKLSENPLKIIRYPLEHYNMNGVSKARSGVAYCARKGINKVDPKDVADWTLIDHLQHAEVAQILKTVTTFYSYDTLTAYSIFAVLCGCDSIVVPDKDQTEESWYPNPADRYGISFGLDNLEKSRETRHLVLPRILSEHDRNASNVISFTNEVADFFSV